MADFWSTLEELEAKSGLPSGPGEEGMTSPALEQEKGPAHIGGALKSSAYGLADSFGYIPEGAAEFVPPMLPGGMAAYEGLTKVGKKWHGFIGKMMKESPDVQDWLKSVEEKKEPYLSELLGSLGTTAGGLVVHKIPYIGTALSASMFYGANKSEIYNAAIEQGADLREAELVSSVGSVISTVPDVIGLEGLARTFRGKALARFLVTIGVGKVAQAIASVGMKEVGDVAFGSVLEGTTEGMQQVAQYVAAKWASRPQGETLGQFSDRMLSEKDQILEEAWHAAKIGAGVGLLAAGGGAAYSRFGPQPKPTPEPEPTTPPPCTSCSHCGGGDWRSFLHCRGVGKESKI